jgi:hypothetical protein
VVPDNEDDERRHNFMQHRNIYDQKGPGCNLERRRWVVSELEEMYEEEGRCTLFHLINISQMPQIGAASSCEGPEGRGDQIMKGSGTYHVRLRGRYQGMGIDMAASSRNIAGSSFLSCVVNGTIGRKHG